MQRKVTGLDSHTKVRLKMRIIPIDTWDNEWAYVSIDNKQVYKKQFRGNNHSGKNLKCGAGTAEWYYDMDYTWNHSASSFTIKVWSNINSSASDESLGIADVQIFTY